MADKDDVLRCTACKGEDLERGKLYSTNAPGMGLGFTPEGADLLSTTPTSSPVYAYICMRCGLIQMYGVRKLVAEAVGRFTG